MARKKTRATRTVLTNPFSEMFAEPELRLSDISMRSYLEQEQENYGKFSTALKSLRTKLINDYSHDTMASNISKTRSYLLTRNEDGSLDLTDVQSVSLETASEHANTCVCLATFKTVKLL